MTAKKRWWLRAGVAAGVLLGAAMWLGGDEAGPERLQAASTAGGFPASGSVAVAPTPTGPVPDAVRARIEAADAMAEALGQVGFRCFVGRERDGLFARFDPSSNHQDFEVRDGWLVGYADVTKGAIWILPTDDVAGMYVHWNARNLGDSVSCEAEVLQYATLQVQLELPDGRPVPPQGEFSGSHVYGCGSDWEQIDDTTWRADRVEANLVGCVVKASAHTNVPEEPLAGLLRWERRQMVLGLRPGETRHLTVPLREEGEGSGLHVEGSLIQVARFGVSTFWDNLTEAHNPISVADEVTMLDDLRTSGELTGDAEATLEARWAQREKERQRLQANREKHEWTQRLLDEQMALVNGARDGEGGDFTSRYQEYLDLKAAHCELARQRLDPDDRALELFCHDG